MLQVALGSVSVKVTPDARASYLSGRFHRKRPAIGYGTPSSPPDQPIALQDCFGGVALGGLPFNVCLVPGDASASHEGRANTSNAFVIEYGFVMAETSAAPAPTLVYLVGPPAVGKMTVGQEIAARTGMRLFHNHMTIELVLQFFEFGSPPFGRLVEEFRQRLMAEVAGSDLPGVIFTFVWAFDLPSELEALERYARPFRQRGGRVLFVELQADKAERLLRNESATRLAEKPSKRDLAASRRNLLELDDQHRLSSHGEFDHRADYLRIDNTHASADHVAERVVEHFGLPVIARSSDNAGC